LIDHAWPGNIRELENVVEQTCVKCTGSRIERRDLPAYLHGGNGSRSTPARSRRRKWLTRELVEQALAENGGNQTRAAHQLGVHRITLWRKMKEFNIPV
jgi:transcriptional regulator of acetoin/glycerol metabolism